MSAPRLARRVGSSAVVASLVALLLGACSGGSSGPTKAEYAKQAGAICRAASASVTKVRADSTSASTLAASIGQVVAIEQTAARRVRALRQPRGDEALLDEWLGLVDQSIAQLDAAARAAAAADVATANAANRRAQDLDRRADDIADRYGLDACAAGA